MTEESTELIKKHPADADDVIPTPSGRRASTIKPARDNESLQRNNVRNRKILLKLFFFVIALLVVPLGTYFYVLNVVTNGSSVAAALSAVFMANGLIVIYVVLAVVEDFEEEKVKKD